MSLNWPPITANTGLDELFAIHRRIWDYVIKHKDKPSTPYLSNCVFCEYAMLKNGSLNGRCDRCPIRNNVGCEYGLYYHWFNSHMRCQRRDAKALAKQIRDITIDEEEM